MLCGTELHSVELFGPQATQVQCECRNSVCRYRSAARRLKVSRDFHGPMLKAFAALRDSAKPALERDITALLDSLNTGGEHALVNPGECLEDVITEA